LVPFVDKFSLQLSLCFTDFIQLWAWYCVSWSHWSWCMSFSCFLATEELRQLVVMVVTQSCQSVLALFFCFTYLLKLRKI